jgi:hypothetical protein
VAAASAGTTAGRDRRPGFLALAAGLAGKLERKPRPFRLQAIDQGADVFRQLGQAFDGAERLTALELVARAANDKARQNEHTQHREPRQEQEFERDSGSVSWQFTVCTGRA